MSRLARAFFLLAVAPLSLFGQASTDVARVREYRQAFPTYPFSDPNPIPNVGRIYPYFRFDGFSDSVQTRTWKVIELENRYIRVLILPEIGGKVWAAIDKKSGRPFIYYNHVVKFRDIAMRGPWTSGGIEANYGIIGHTPNVSTPVDYVTRKNADGSVSATVGVQDLLTMTTWRVETRVTPGAAWFATASTWYNGSGLEQPYYTWMTAGIPVRGNLQYVFPGSAWIGHEGETGEWPTNGRMQRDVNWYERNDFGPYKSYHVLGEAADFFGAWWHDHNFGMARVSPRDEKPGQKIWIWGLSRQGMIWEDLLTDTDGQYSELQSGRLFNQSAEGSTLTPFKHRGFPPYVLDRWTEYWMPIAGTGGFVTASAAGALNVQLKSPGIVVSLSPAERINDTLVVTAGTQRWVRRIVREPMRPWVDTLVATGVSIGDVSVVLGDDRLTWRGRDTAAVLDRPLQSPAAFDWSSAYGLHLRGKEWLRQREYGRARGAIDSALALSPHYLPALADRALLALRSFQWSEARQYARAALAIDTYDGAANYYYGLANLRLGRVQDARDGLEIASQSVEFRQAAWIELSKFWLAIGDERRALSYADKALAGEMGAVDAYGVRAVAARRRGDRAGWTRAVAAIERADPLSVQARYERFVMQRMPNAGTRLLQSVQAELPEQQLFSLAAWYQSVGERRDALAILSGVGEHPEALYWRAAIDTASAEALITRANALSPRLVFPFRSEVVSALEGAVSRSSHWKPSYYLALGLWGANRVQEAAARMERLGEQPDFAPFYAARAALPNRRIEQRIADLRRAATLDPTEWRYGKLLTERLMERGAAQEAADLAIGLYQRFPANYIVGMTLARARIGAGRFAAADSLLSVLRVIPFEGSAEGRSLYREAKLMLAIDALEKQGWEQALGLVGAAREWPERLGAGRPYAENVDERLEDWVASTIRRRRGDAGVGATLDGWAAEHARGPDGVERRVIRRLTNQQR